VDVERESSGEPFQAHRRPAYAALAAAMEEAYGRPLSTLGQGGSIPLCNVFADTYPNAETILMGGGGTADPDARPQRERPPR
jgi:cysteinylglycine-S-conjugate dipeptidase